jgi:mediator of RNA polymerase II transcription subunit 10
MEHLQEALESFIEKLRVVGVIAGDYQMENAATFKDKIRELTDSMHEISGLQSELSDVHIPLEVVEHVDKGGNPELYTQRCLRETLEKCSAMKSKQKAYKEFREQLVQKLSQAFPEVIQQYKSSHSQGQSS